ncbi:hypothetical protein LSAT2_031380 [Lamellibrachia satsuma]|nr:hypothetical protein LSAT2_031380 [Lamellibrachia satsuma]
MSTSWLCPHFCIKCLQCPTPVLRQLRHCQAGHASLAPFDRDSLEVLIAAEGAAQGCPKVHWLGILLSSVYPSCFQKEEIYKHLSTFVKDEDDVVSDYTLQIFYNIGQKMQKNFPAIHTSLLPVLQKLVKLGTPKQAKHAIRCIHALYDNRDAIYQQIFEHLQANLELESPYFLTTLVAIGHIAQLCPGKFAMPVRGIVSKFIVKELLMQDRIVCRRSTESWCADHLVSEETQAKLQGLKLMVRWLIGLKSNSGNSGTSTLRLLNTLILHDGDLMERGAINKAEMARLRLQATCCVLKLAQEHCYADLITLEQFQTLALLLNDPCYQVRVRFAQKLNKGLLAFRLPLQYLSTFCLTANDPLKERRTQVKQFLLANISRRREYLRQHSAANARMFALLPDYAVPYAIHLLAHDPDLRSHEDIDTLKNIRECLWFLLEPLMKSETYSYSFYRKLVENIKQTKDIQCMDSPEANKKLYAVCDLVLGIILSKTSNFMLKDFPAEPVLPAKLFTQPDQSYSNTKCYLPRELMVQVAHMKKLGPGIIAPAAATATSSKKDTCEPSSPSSPPAASPPDHPTKPSAGLTRARGYTASPSPSSSVSSGGQSPDRPTGRGVRKAAAPAPRTGKTGSGIATRRHRSGSGSSSNSKASSRKHSPDPGQKSSQSRDTESASPTSSPEPKKSAAASGSATKPSTGQSKITDFVTRARMTLGSPAVAASAKSRTAAAKNNKKPSAKEDKLADEKLRSTNGGTGESEGRGRRKPKVAVVESPATRSGKRVAVVSTEHNLTVKRAKVNATKISRGRSPEHNGDSSSTRSSPRKSSSQDSKASTRTRAKVAAAAAGVATKSASDSTVKTNAARRNVRRTTSTTNSVSTKGASATSSPSKRTRSTDDSEVAELSVRRRNKKRR